MEAGVVVGQASSSNMKHSSRNMNVAIASEHSSGSSSISEAEAGRPGSLNRVACLGECVWLVVRGTKCVTC